MYQPASTRAVLKDSNIHRILNASKKGPFHQTPIGVSITNPLQTLTDHHVANCKKALERCPERLGETVCRLGTRDYR